MCHYPNLRKTSILQQPFAWTICLIIFNSLLLDFNAAFSPSFLWCFSCCFGLAFSFCFYKTTRTALKECSWHVQNMLLTPWRASIYTKQSCTGKLQRHSEVASQALLHLELGREITIHVRTPKIALIYLSWVQGITMPQQHRDFMEWTAKHLQLRTSCTEICAPTAEGPGAHKPASSPQSQECQARLEWCHLN